MKTLERYILAEFVKIFLIAVISFIMLFVMVDVFENMDNILKYNVPIRMSVLFFIYKIPFIVSQITPVAVLVSALLSLGMLSRHGEITAIKAGGIYLLRVVAPLLIAGLVISIAVIAMNESVTSNALKKVDAFRKQWFGYQNGTFSREGMWVKTPRGIINIKQFEPRKNRINGITLHVVEKPFSVRGRVTARLAEWKGGRWVAAEASAWSFSKDGSAVKTEAKDYAFDDLLRPEDLMNFENLQKDMNFLELRHYVRELELEGYDASRYEIDMYGKITFPLVNFLMVLVGIPFALKTGRNSGIAMGVGLSVVIAFGYWVIFAVMRSLGQNGMLPPIVAAAFPDILFLAVGTLMFGYVRE